MERTTVVVLGVVVLAQMSERPREPYVIVVEPAPVVQAQREREMETEEDRDRDRDPDSDSESDSDSDSESEPEPLAVRGLGPCPAPYRRGTDVEMTTPVDDESALEVTGIAASAYDVRLIAVWNGLSVALSLDEGRSWKYVLEHHTGVADALFDCHGRLHVLRTDGTIGTWDDGAEEIETWIRAAEFHDASDRGRLVIDRDGVAAIGPDPVAHDRLILARRDARERWRSVPLVDDPEYGSWDGIAIERIEPAGKGRFRMLAMPWQGGECGYSRYLDVTFDLDARRVKVAQLGEELPKKSRWHEPEITDTSLRVRDAAGRWIVWPGDGDEPQLQRARKSK
jgi:hypothetical protein